ncbi:hypothetical protein OROMI_003297 [Orobanche minor]
MGSIGKHFSLFNISVGKHFSLARLFSAHSTPFPTLLYHLISFILLLLLHILFEMECVHGALVSVLGLETPSKTAAFMDDFSKGKGQNVERNEATLKCPSYPAESHVCCGLPLNFADEEASSMKRVFQSVWKGAESVNFTNMLKVLLGSLLLVFKKSEVIAVVNPPDDKGYIYGLGSLGVALCSSHFVFSGF